MTTVLSDTSPLNYLVQIGQSSLLPSLFGEVSIAAAVGEELSRPRTPDSVRNWFASKPSWLKVETTAIWNGPKLPLLHDGERETLVLALAIGAELVIMDDRAGVSAGRARGLRVTGTIGVLDIAAERKLIDLSEAVRRLRATNFRVAPGMIEKLLARHRPERKA